MIRSRLIAAGLILTLTTFMAGPATGAGPIITGVVTDAFGAPIQSAYVSDGPGTTTTDASGRYQLVETSPGTYIIAVQKIGYVKATRAVNTLTNTSDVNFGLKYTISSTVNRQYISTAGESYTLVQTVLSSAPDPTVRSCAMTKDTSTNTTSPMVLDSVSGALATWKWTREIPAGASEGSWALQAWVESCTDQTALDSRASSAYVVDNTDPTIDPRKLIPGNHANTVFASQSLMAKASDSGSGIDASSIRFSLNPGGTYVGSWSSATLWARKLAVALNAGTDYEVSLTLSDQAGNSATLAWSFRAIASPEIANTQVSLFAAGKNTGQSGALGTETWTFDPEVSLPNRKIAFSTGSAHPGWGTLVNEVPLENARLQIVLGGSSQSWPTAPYPRGKIQEIYQQFSYAAGGTGSSRVTLGGEIIRLEPISLDLPLGTSEATIVLEDTESAAEFGGVCSNPEITLGGCSPDPLPFFIPTDLADRLMIRETEDGVEDCGVTTYVNCYVASAAIGIFKLVLDNRPPVATSDLLYDPNMVWQGLNPYAGFSCGPYSGSGDSDTLCLVSGALYSPTAMVVPPVKFAEVCSTADVCTFQTSEQRFWDRRLCISLETGRDLPGKCGAQGCSGEGSERCQQTYYLDPVGLTSTSSLGRLMVHFSARWDSEWGVDDGPYDELGLHWSTSGKTMTWEPAQPSEVTAGTNHPPIYASSGFEMSGLYPQDISGNPTPNALKALNDCAQGSVTAAVRTKTDSTGYAYGVGTGSEIVAGSRGWRQLQNLDCGTGANATMRKQMGVVHAWMVQGSAKFGSRRTNGHVLATYGHQEVKFDFTWQFVAGAAACALAAPRCNPVGLIFNAAGSTKTDETVTTKPRSNAFFYD